MNNMSIKVLIDDVVCAVFENNETSINCTTGIKDLSMNKKGWCLSSSD